MAEQLVTVDVLRQREAAVRLFNGECTIQEALLSAGAGEATARMGKAGMPKAMREMMAKLALGAGRELADIGKQLDPAAAENMIAGKLVTNMIAGETKGNDAAALLGKMRRYNAFEKDSFAGVVVLTPGSAVAGKKLESPDSDDVIDLQL